MNVMPNHSIGITGNKMKLAQTEATHHKMNTVIVGNKKSKSKKNSKGSTFNKPMKGILN